MNSIGAKTYLVSTLHTIKLQYTHFTNTATSSVKTQCLYINKHYTNTEAVTAKD